MGSHREIDFREREKKKKSKKKKREMAGLNREEGKNFFKKGRNKICFLKRRIERKL